MSELPVPDQNLEYGDVRSLQKRVSTLFGIFLRHRGDIELHQHGNAIELIKPIAGLLDGETSWLSLLREIDGRTQLFRVSRITQQEFTENDMPAMRASVTTYSFLAFDDVVLAPIHSAKWSEKKQLGANPVPAEEHGALLDVRMSRAVVYDVSDAAPILQEDLPEIEGILDDWR